MNLKKDEIKKSFDKLFEFHTEKEELEHGARMIMARFLSELQPIIEEKGLNKRDIADILKTSASYVTQLYNGDKITNLITLYKLEKHFDITFNIKAYCNIKYENNSNEIINFLKAKSEPIFTVYKNLDYELNYDSDGTKYPNEQDELKQKIA